MFGTGWAQTWARVCGGGVMLLAFSAGFAEAHHAMDGKTPDTFMAGLISGLAHPVIGFDHLAFVVAAAVVAAFAGARFLLAAVFIVATLFGCLATVAAGGALSGGEYVVAASVLLVGGLVMSGRRIAVPVLAAFFGAAGLFHGMAYGESIVGAEPTPLAAYFAGFGLVQFAIMVGVAWLARATYAVPAQLPMQVRLVGGVVAGIGATFIVELGEKVIFASV